MAVILQIIQKFAYYSCIVFGIVYLFFFFEKKPCEQTVICGFSSNYDHAPIAPNSVVNVQKKCRFLKQSPHT